MVENDKECVQLCLKGKPEAFRQLVERYETFLIKHLYARLGDSNEAAEAAQETFVRAYVALAKLKKADSFSSWLLGIANRVVMESRRAQRRRAASFDAHGLPELQASEDESQDHHEVELKVAVASLPSVQRQVILMRFYNGQSCAEISRVLGVSLGTVTSRLSRAYALLREAMRMHAQDAEIGS